MRKWEVGRYTPTQLVNALDTSDPDDPHAGNVPVSGLGDLQSLLEDLGIS